MRKLLWISCVVVIWAAAVAGRVDGGVILSAAAAPPPEDPCMQYLFELIDCVSYVENGSNTTKPDPACCPELKPVLDHHPLCLCEIIKPGANIAGIYINVTRAMGLPALCAFTPFPVDKCPPDDVPSPPPAPPSPAPVPPPPSPSAPSGTPPSEGKGAKALSLSIVAALFSLAVVAACSFV